MSKIKIQNTGTDNTEYVLLDVRRPGSQAWAEVHRVLAPGEEFEMFVAEGPSRVIVRKVAGTPQVSNEELAALFGGEDHGEA